MKILPPDCILSDPKQIRKKEDYLCINFYQFHRQYVLKHLPVVLARLEAEDGVHQLAGVELARGQLPQHGCHVRVFVLAAQLLQHDVALHHLTAFGLLTLHGEGFALHDDFQ